MRSQPAVPPVSIDSSPDYYGLQLAMELKQRQIGNPRYSLRAFAKTLGLSPAHLSKVIRGEKRLSMNSAAKVALRLHYNEVETKQFCELVSHGQIKNEEFLLALNKGGNSESLFPALPFDSFQAVADWYHCGLRELTDCHDFDPRPEKIAQRLGISREEAVSGLKRLIRIGLLKKQGSSYKKTAESFTTGGGPPSSAVRHFHSQMIQKAADALAAQSVNERDISGITLAISPNKMELAKEEIRRFRRRMAKCLETARPTVVYQLNVQFFRLSAVREAEEKRMR